MSQSNLNAEAQRRHNARNTFHTILLVVGSAVLMGLMAYSVLGVIGLIGAAVVGALMVAGLGRTSPKMVLGLYKARALGADELPDLQQIVRELAKRADLPAVPHLYYVPSQMMNAFAVGSKDDSAIAVTDGLLRAMNVRQLAGILGHETAHIMNGDLRVMGMADVLNRITSFMSTIGLVGIPVIFGVGVNLPLYGLGLLIFAPMLGGLLQLGLSRAREYDADLDGASLTGDPEGLASALKVLEEKNRGLLESLALPGGRMNQPSIMRTHPKTEDRIARLLAVRATTNEQIVIRQHAARPQTSFVPQVRAPRVQWHRMGVYY